MGCQGRRGGADGELGGGPSAGGRRSTAQVSTYDSVAEGKLSLFGLEPPRCTLSFVAVLSENTPETRAGEQVIASVAIGKSEGGHLFVKIGEAPEVLSVPESLMNAIPLDPVAWVSPG